VSEKHGALLFWSIFERMQIPKDSRNQGIDALENSLRTYTVLTITSFYYGILKALQKLKSMQNTCLTFTHMVLYDGTRIFILILPDPRSNNA
jgi:hypothetical protein